MTTTSNIGAAFPGSIEGAIASNAAAFTPGPWWGGVISQHQPLADEILKEFAEHRDGTLGAIADSNDRFLAFIATVPNTLAEDRANAHLIAAAPELYAELQQFVNGVETRMIDSPADETLANVTRRAKAALAKARGETA